MYARLNDVVKVVEDITDGLHTEGLAKVFGVGVCVELSKLTVYNTF